MGGRVDGCGGEQVFRNRWVLRLCGVGWGASGEGEEAWRNWNCYKVAS